MSAVRDFFGSNCPSCRQDILQACPSTNRMPGADKAWCPRCDARFTADQLANVRKPSIMKRLFGGRPTNA